MFKIKISGVVYEVDNVEIRGQHLFIDGADQGPVGYTFASKVIEGEYDFIQKQGSLRWVSK